MKGIEFNLRPWDLKEREELAELANNFNIARFMTNQFPHPYTIAHADIFLAMASSHKPSHIMAIEVNGHPAGSIGIHPQNDIMCRNAELGYWLGEKYWGKGIISNAIPRMVKYAFENFEVNRIFARPFGNNPASARALQKAGFALEARFEKTILKNDELLDELVYAIRKKT